MNKSFMRIFAVVFGMMLSVGLISAQENILTKDWAKLGRYAKANEEVKAQSTGRPKAVLYGDSITDAWPRNDADFFKDNGFIGRGISGQTTSEMLVRFRQDVLDLNPKYVVILAGINDVACNNGYISQEAVMDNLKSICELAALHGVKPILCTMLPSSGFTWRPERGEVSAEVDALNEKIRAYAKSKKIKLVDYAKAMTSPQERFPKKYTKDDVHPNLAGYKVMEAELLKILK